MYFLIQDSSLPAWKQRERLLILLENKSKADFQKFKNVLNETDQRFIVDHLDDTGKCLSDNHIENFYKET